MSNRFDPYHIAAWIVITLSALLRLIVFIQNRSIFLDEANLARNIIEKDIAGFFAPLDYQQYAPPLFLILEKINWLLFGNTEQALRLLPLLSGIAGIYFFYLLLKRTIPSPQIYWFPLFLLGFSPYFLQFATEAKQYGTDIFFTILILYLAVRTQEKGWNKSSFIIWGIGGSVLIWLSMPSVFILFGIGCFFIFRELKNQEWKKLGPVIAMIFPWVVSFGIYYFLILSTDLGKDYLVDYHRPYFFPFPPYTAEHFQRIGHILLSILSTAAGFTVLAHILSTGLILLGIKSFRRRHPNMLIITLLPLGAVILASSLERYSLMPRLSLFFIPIILLLIAEGASFLWIQSNRFGKIALSIGLLSLLPLQKGYLYFFQPYQIEEIRPVLKTVNEQKKPDDLVIIHHNAIPAFEFYTNYHRLHKTLRFSGEYLGDWDDTALSAIQKAGPSKRIWIVFSHQVSDHDRALSVAFVSPIADRADLIKEILVKGAKAQLFEWKE